MQPVQGAATTEVIAVLALLPSLDSAMSLFGSTVAVTDSEVPAVAVTVVVIVTVTLSPAFNAPVQSTFPTGPVETPDGVQMKPPDAAAEARSRPAGRLALTTTAFGAGSVVVAAEPALVTTIV